MIREKTNNLNTVSEQWLQYVLFTRKYSTYVKYQNRSEERRVGKERRSRWSPYH